MAVSETSGMSANESAVRYRENQQPHWTAPQQHLAEALVVHREHERHGPKDPDHFHLLDG